MPSRADPVGPAGDVGTGVVSGVHDHHFILSQWVSWWCAQLPSPHATPSQICGFFIIMENNVNVDKFQNDAELTLG